jgi:hypothetical protein
MTSKNGRCCCTPVKYKNHQYHHHSTTHHHHSAVNNNNNKDDVIEPPNLKKNMSNTAENNNHCHDQNDTSSIRTCHITDTNTNTSSATTVLYYSRYTTARLRASTPNQRSPLYARQLRFWKKNEKRVEKKDDLFVCGVQWYNIHDTHTIPRDAIAPLPVIMM